MGSHRHPVHQGGRLLFSRNVPQKVAAGKTKTASQKREIDAAAGDSKKSKGRGQIGQQAEAG